MEGARPARNRDPTVRYLSADTHHKRVPEVTVPRHMRLFALAALIPALAIACQSRAGNVLQRQLVAAGLKNVKGVILEGCAHWIYEENPDETLPVRIL